MSCEKDVYGSESRDRLSGATRGSFAMLSLCLSDSGSSVSRKVYYTSLLWYYVVDCLDIEILGGVNPGCKSVWGN